MKFPINTSTYSGFLWDFQGTFFLLNNDQRIYPPVSPAAYHEISWCIVLRQSCRASDWWRMWVKQSHTHTHTTHDWEWRVYTTWWWLGAGLLFDPHIIWDRAPIWIQIDWSGWNVLRWFPNTMIPSTRATSHGIVWTRKKQTVQVHTWHDWLIDDDYLWLMMITDD